MHVDYVREQYHKLTHQKHVENWDCLQFLRNFCLDEFIDHAHQVGDEKTRSICETMQKSHFYKNNPRSYKKITYNQMYAVAEFLLKKYGHAKTVISKVFNIPLESVDLTEEEINKLR